MPPGPSDHADGAHLHHGVAEVVEEASHVGRVGGGLRVRGAAAAEELLVRVEQALVPQQVPVVEVVEDVGRGRVQRRRVVVAAAGRARAPRLQRRRQRRVQAGGLVVEAAAEVDAPRLPDRVSARQRDHVARAQPLLGEGLDEVAEVQGRRWEVVVRVVQARRRPVPPAELHVPRRPAELHACRGEGAISLSPPCMEMEWKKLVLLGLRVHVVLTATTESRAATARMSAQETVWLHASSSCALMSSTTSNPRSEFLFGCAVFSPVKPGASSSSTDPSQPCKVSLYCSQRLVHEKHPMTRRAPDVKLSS